MTADLTAAGLLAAILANPGDDLVRLAYADWIEEQGEGERAEFIRVQVELAQPECTLQWFFTKAHDEMLAGMSKLERGSAGDETRQRARSKARRLLDAHQQVRAALKARERELWREGVCLQITNELPGLLVSLAHVPPGQSPWGVISRGFCSRVRLSLGQFLGGPCGCTEDGACRDPYGDSTCLHCPSHAACKKCPVCNGSRTTPGIGRRLAACQPVEVWEFTDFAPTPGSGDYWYLDGLAEASGDGHDPRMWGDLEEGVWDSAEEAQAALNAKAVAWATAAG